MWPLLFLELLLEFEIFFPSICFAQIANEIVPIRRLLLKH